MNNESGRFRSKKVNFTQVSNTVLLDENLSLKAKGMFSLIQHYITIPDFILYKNTLKKVCKEKEKAFQTAWDELKNAGYLMQYKMRDKETKRFYYEYDLLDIPNPHPQKPHVENPPYGKATLGKGGVYNKTDLNNTNSNNNYLNKINNIHTFEEPKSDSVNFKYYNDELEIITEFEKYTTDNRVITVIETFYFMLEKYKGIKQGKLTENRIKYIVEQITSGLLYIDDINDIEKFVAYYLIENRQYHSLQEFCQEINFEIYAAKVGCSDYTADQIMESR